MDLLKIFSMLKRGFGGLKRLGMLNLRISASSRGHHIFPDNSKGYTALQVLLKQDSTFWIDDV